MSNDTARLEFKIDSPEQSRRLQEVLFKLGHRWYNRDSDGQIVRDVEYASIQTWEDGYLARDVRLTNNSKFTLTDTEAFIKKHSTPTSEGVQEIPSEILAPDFLRAALNHMAERAKTYDSPEGERSMGKAVEAFNAITGHSLKESEGWLLLQLLKDTRQWSRTDFHLDSAEDCVAFAALKGEALSREGK